MRNSNNNDNNGNRNNNNGNRNLNNGNRYNNTNEANNRYNGNRPDVPNGGRNGDHGLIGGSGGVQRQVGANQQRAGRLSSDQQPRSAMNGNGNWARASANRGRTSMHPAAFQRQRPVQQRQQHVQQPRQQRSSGGARGGGRR